MLPALVILVVLLMFVAGSLWMSITISPRALRRRHSKYVTIKTSPVTPSSKGKITPLKSSRRSSFTPQLPSKKSPLDTASSAVKSSLRPLSAEEIYEERQALRVELNSSEDYYHYDDFDEDDAADRLSRRQQENNQRLDRINRRYERDFTDLQIELEEHLYNNPPFLYNTQEFEDRINELKGEYQRDIDDLEDDLNDQRW